ncbi:MAG TPA: extracellular solute-binding protein [Candidatus Sumerlaeota bacterium]|nr:extracellular solute-binding protein [Candidatus Sumerlaeota bacterium]
MNSNYGRALNIIARRYEALHPDVKVRISLVTVDYSTWLRTQFAGGERIAPDIYNGNYTAEYIGLGRWESLTDELEDVNPYTGKPWIESLNRPLTERFYYGGEAYFIPLDFIDVAFVYNKSIFDQLGLEPPRTWDELIAVCREIRERGHGVSIRGKTGNDIIPMAMSGNAQDFWEGPVGWLARIIGDAYFRSEVALVKAQPGDWNYEPSRDAVFNSDFSNPYNDVNVTINSERLLQAFQDGTIRGDLEKARAVYTHIKDLSEFWPPGFQGINFGSSEALFVRQRAAMLFTTTHFVTHSERLWREMNPEDRFEWGSFSPPSITGDPLCEGPTLRGIGNAGANYVVTKKSDREHVDRVIDFLRFLTTPESGTTLFQETLNDDQFIVGPIQIQGVKMAPELAEKYRAFEGRGFEKLDLRGAVVQYEWTLLAQDLLAGSGDMDRFLAEYDKLLHLRVDREVRRFYLDMNPATKDEPPATAPEHSRWNPLRNGVLAVSLLFVGWLAFSVVKIRGAKGGHGYQGWLAIMLLAPTFLLVCSFVAWPALSGIASAFTDWEDARPGTFVGLANFKRLFTDYFIWKGMSNMAIITAANLMKATVIPFSVALMLRSLPWPRISHGVRTLFLLPMVTPVVTGILLWAFIYDPNIGMLNDLLNAFGFKGYAWLGERSLALPSLIGMGFPWIGGLNLLIYLAGLLAIDHSVREAASLECRNRLQRIVYIEIPLVAPQTRLVIVTTLIVSLQDFQTMLLLTGGGPGLETSVPALQMYERAFKFGEFGYASTIGLMLFTMVLASTMIAHWLFGRKKEA